MGPSTLITMKKTLTVLVAITFLGSSLSLPAFAAVKSGAKCATKDQIKTSQGKKYTCIKSGKKLVWNKGVLVIKPATEPVATPQKVIFTPWATEFDVASMTQIALDAARFYFGKVTPSNNYEITFDPAISLKDRAWILEGTDFAYGSFSKINGERPIIYIGATREWAKEALKNKNIWIGDPNDLYPCSARNDDAGCVGDNKMLLLFRAGRLLNAGSAEKFLMKTATSHEMFHIIQERIHRNVGPGNPARIPQWLMEGSAAFYQFYAGDELGFDKYQTGRDDLVTRNSDYRTIVPLSQYDGGGLNPYGIGMAASEYIIASIGFENFMNIWIFTKSENSFAAGFKKATGIEIDTFYSKFEVARGAMRIGS